MVLCQILPLNLLHAQEPSSSYRPFVEEGKVWTVGRLDSENGEVVETWTYYFDGDTVIQDKACKLLFCRTTVADGDENVRLVAPIFDEDRKVWFFCQESSDEEAKLLYDFSAKENDAVLLSVPDFTVFEKPAPNLEVSGEWESLCTFKAVLPVSIQGIDVRCFCFWNEWSEGASRYDFYLEGIGSTFAPDFNVFTDDPANGYRLLECRVGGKLIYTSADNPQATINAHAEQQEAVDTFPYRPFIEEGKEWIVHRFHIGNNSLVYTSDTFYFGGDTIVAGLPCKKLMCSSMALNDVESITSLSLLVFEKERCVRFFRPGTTEALTLYDFNARRGDLLTLDGAGGEGYSWRGVFQVWDTQLLSVGGGHFRAQRASDYTHRNDLQAVYDYKPDHLWLEGIGSLASPVKNIGLNVTGDYRILAQCSVRGEVIYENDVYGLLSVSSPQASLSSSPLLFDLSGRRLSASPAKGIYIENGQKKLKVR